MKEKFRSKLEEYGIPEYMRGALEKYVYNRKPVGDFLRAVICNDLKEAVIHADEVNEKILSVYVRFLYNCVPSGCWGSYEKYGVWVNGLDKREI